MSIPSPSSALFAADAAHAVRDTIASAGPAAAAPMAAAPMAAGRATAGPAPAEPVAASPAAAAVASAATAVRRFRRRRFALLVLAGVYPVITALLYVVLPLTEGWAIWQRTLVIAPMMVAIMVWGLIPTIQTRFAGWINPALPAR